MRNTSETAKMIGGCGCWGLIILMIVLACIGYFGNLDKSEKFRSYIPKYKNITNKSSDGGPYLKGKVIIVDSDNNDIYTGDKFVPSELIADSPDEVGTVVLISRNTTSSGLYEYKDSKYHDRPHVGHLYLTLIDNTIPAIIDQRDFYHDEAGVNSEGQLYEKPDTADSDKLDDEATEYLNKLPRR
ncbi:MAG TPA: hypothetical protein VFA07_10775 [Chthonomonadaceae bacterium]|nr:hypothetical protein [Chthonomonadaceae bacterium]